MSRTIVTDGELGKLARKQNELFARVKKGTLPIDRVLKELQQIIENKVPCCVWKMIKLGTELKTGDDFCRQIRYHGCRISDRAKYIINKPAFTVGDEWCEIRLVIKSVAELGFPNGSTWEKVCDNAISLGLELCPAEVGPQLRLQYLNQPKDEWLCVAMESIDGSVLSIGNDIDGLWLDVNNLVHLHADCLVVFVEPRR